MGQYHMLVNLDKKQFVDPHGIGNGLKLLEQVGWNYSTSTALVMLLAASNKGGCRGGGDFRGAHPLVGSWAGDRVAFIGDYGTPGDLPLDDAGVLYRACRAVQDPKGYEDEEKPEGWSAWVDISAPVRQMMSFEFEIKYKGTGGWLKIEQAEGR